MSQFWESFSWYRCKMKIEQEIQQKSFKSEHQKLAINILFTNGWLMSLQKNLFSNSDITSTQFNILRILRGQFPNPLSINLLKSRMLDKMSDTSRLVERLRLKGYVKRKICSDDRRKSDVSITKKGMKLLEKLDYVDNEFENLLSGLSKKEAKSLNNLLDKLRDSN